MGIRDHATTFAGRPVRDYDPDVGIEDPTGVVYRLRLDWSEVENPEMSVEEQTEAFERLSLLDRLGEFLDDPLAPHVPALVIGRGADFANQITSGKIAAALMEARERLPRLRGLFFGDITSDECAISALSQCPMRPLLEAYPALEYLQVRGGYDFSFGGPSAHASLRSLVIETAGLCADIARDIAESNLPNLEHLELWLGARRYGMEATMEDLMPILEGTRLPKLEYLGLRNAEIADEVAIAVSKSPILERINVLDLSLGNLSNIGAKALLKSPAVAKLRKLDLHHHFVSERKIRKLRRLGIEVDDRDHQTNDIEDVPHVHFIAVEI